MTKSAAALCLGLVTATAVAMLSPPCALAAVGRTGDPPPDIYALIVGYNGGRPGLPDLRYADDDAARFALFFGGLAGAREPPSVWLLSDLDQQTLQNLRAARLTPPPARAPTRAGLLQAIAEIRQRLASRSGRNKAVLYFIYAGHGLQGRILLKPDGAPEAAITGRELRAALADVPVDHTLMFLDACRSQSLFSERGVGVDSEIGPDLSAQVSELERRSDAVRIGVVTAAATGRPAGEVRSLQAGYFSHVLASGLAGAADADGDDVVSFGEIAAFVAFNTERLTGQRPWFDPPGGDLSVSAIDHRGRAPRLIFAAPAAGRYVVEATSGRPVFAEAFKDRRRTLKLVVAPGRYRVRQLPQPGDRGGVADVEVSAGQVLEVADSAWQREDGAMVSQRDAEQPSTADPRAEVAGGGAGSGSGGSHDDIGAGAESGGAFEFSSPFTPDIVSTLAAGYRAGREPSSTSTARDSFAVALGLGRAALELGGRELGVVLNYRHRRGAAIFGFRSETATSTHSGGGESYRLRRWGLAAESGLRWRPTATVELAGTGAVGFKALLRLADDTSGDLWGPAVSAGVSVSAVLFGPVWGTVDVRYGVHWIQLDGARRASRDPTVAVGAGVAF